jgi:hypothetical protein
LKWRDVRPDLAELTIRAETTKTHTERVIPILSRLRSVLVHTNLATTSTYLNVTRTGLAESMRKYDAGRPLHNVAPEAAEERPLSGNEGASKRPQPTIN